MISFVLNILNCVVFSSFVCEYYQHLVFFCGFVSYLPFPNFSLKASSPWVFWTCFFIPANEGTMWEQLSTGQWWGRFKRSSSWSFGWDGCLKAFLHYPLKPSGILILSSPTTTCDAFSTISTISPPKNKWCSDKWC